MSEVRIIKKYGNRRLYCTRESRYVNLGEVAALVRDGEEVQVVDAKTGDDLTRQVLTQIIIENSRQDEGPPLDFLRNLVRTTDRANKDFFQWYLGQATEAYHKVQESMGPRFKWPSIEEQRATWSKILDPFGVVRSLTTAHRPAEDSQDGDDEAPQPPETAKPEPPAEASTADDEDRSDTAGELAALKSRLEELEDRLTRS